MNIEAFLNDLPNNLKIELTQVMYKHLIEEIQFFGEKPSSFVAFVAPQLKNL